MVCTDFATRLQGLRQIAFCSCIFILSFGCSRNSGEPESTANDEPKPETSSLKTQLRHLVFEGPELHESLRTRDLGSVKDLPTGIVSPSNPHISNDKDFVRSVSRAGSQGRLEPVGMRMALFARYSAGKNELGFYGLEAETKADADAREKMIREIWAHNASFGRSKVYRNGLVLLVIWHNEVSPECWEAVNAKVSDRMKEISTDED